QTAIERSAEIHDFARLQLRRQRRFAKTDDDDAASSLQRALPFVTHAFGVHAMRRFDQQQGRRVGERILEIALPIVSGLEILDVHPRRKTGAKQMKSKRFGEVIVLARVTYEYRRF